MSMADEGYHKRRASSATLRREADGLAFDKYEGLGNDFIIVDARAHDAPTQSLETRVALCDRQFGVGGDGVLTLLRPRVEGAVVRMHVTNADGSEPEMCGNGLRCVSRWLLDRGLVDKNAPHDVDTDAGVRRVRVTEERELEVDMGPATLLGGAHPQGGADIVTARGTFPGYSVSMGNPHLVLRAPADVELALEVGPVLEHHPAFPARTNVGFAAPRDASTLDLVVFERGSGLTLACGTGACAAAAAMVEAGFFEADAPIAVCLPGGTLTIRIPSNAAESVRMTGPARRVFTGNLAFS